MKLLMMKTCPLSRHFLPLGPIILLTTPPLSKSFLSVKDEVSHPIQNNG
jgi:hypothetical protein